MTTTKGMKKFIDTLINGRKIRARFNKGGNVKVGDMWTFNTLFGNYNYYIPELKKHVRGTCGFNCKGCIKDCYVKKSYVMYTKRNTDGTKGDFVTGKCSVKYGHAINTLAMRENAEKAYNDLNNQIKRRRNKNKELIIRIHASGELESASELIVFTRIARDNADVKLYVYTKNYNLVLPALKAGIIPENLVILFSVWNEYGIKEFLSVSHLPNVKAYVALTGFDYEKAGLHITCRCPAYVMDKKTGKVKLIHDTTCDKCRICFNCIDKLKVIGCLLH